MDRPQNHFRVMTETFASFLYAAGIAIVLEQSIAFDRQGGSTHLTDPMVVMVILVSILHISVDWLAHTRFHLPRIQRWSSLFETVRALLWILCAISLVAFHIAWIEGTVCIKYPLNTGSAYCGGLSKPYRVYFAAFLLTTFLLNVLFIFFLTHRRPWRRFIVPLLCCTIQNQAWFLRRYSLFLKVPTRILDIGRGIIGRPVTRRGHSGWTICIANFGAMHFAIFPLFLTLIYLWPLAAQTIRDLPRYLPYSLMFILVGGLFARPFSYKVLGLLLPIAVLFLPVYFLDLDNLIWVIIGEQIALSLAVVIGVTTESKATEARVGAQNGKTSA